MKKLFVVTGEYSGDIHASHVINALHKLNPDITIEGIGGDNMQKAGVKLFANNAKMASVGLSPQIIINHIFIQINKKYFIMQYFLFFIYFQGHADNEYMNTTGGK